MAAHKKTAFDKLLAHEVSKHGLGVGVYKITPDLAAALLTDPACQIDYDNDELRDRGTSETRVENYAKIMAEGNWRLNGEALIFDQQYRRLNGKHRLKAVVKSKATILSLVIWNLPTEVFSTIDRGKVRSDKDIAQIAGVRSAPVLVPMANWIAKYHLGLMVYKCNPFGNVEKLTEWLLNKEEALYPSMSYAIRARTTKVRFKLLSQSMLGALHYLTSTTEDPERTEAFWDQLTTGAGMTEGSPPLMLTRTLTGYANPSIRTPDFIKCAVTIKAYNHYMQGTPVRQLIYRPATDAFPSVIWNSPLGEGRF